VPTPARSLVEKLSTQEKWLAGSALSSAAQSVQEKAMLTPVMKLGMSKFPYAVRKLISFDACLF
jgi:hypothetical protein